MTTASHHRTAGRTGGMPRSIRPLDLAVWVPYVTLATIHIIALAGQSPVADPTKLTLMPLLAVPVLAAAPRLRPRITSILLLTALLFSWLGDGAGRFFPGGPELPLMLLFFGLAHVAYIALFLRYTKERRMPWWALVYVAWWVGMLFTLGPHTGALFVAVAAYGLILAATAATAARSNPVVALGGAFFLASDTILAFRLFLPAAMPDWTSPAVMLTYTIGQGLIIAGTLRALRRRTT